MTQLRQVGREAAAHPPIGHCTRAFNSRRSRDWRATVARAMCVLTLSAGLVNWSESPAAAQVETRTVPGDGYMLALGPFYQGDYNTAMRLFRSAARSGVKSTEGSWIDSICYHTMIGECHYRAGELGAAMENYEAALKLYLQHRDWMLRVQFPETIAESSRVTRITWGSSSRRVTPGNFPDRMASFQGRLDNEEAVRSGGVIAPPQFYPIRATEIIRCTALAMHRRRELLGPLGSHDTLNAQLVEALARRPGPANHWSQAWINAQLGMAYAAQGKAAEAAAELQRSLVVGGNLDHPLAPLALLTLGNLMLDQRNYDAAATYYAEASFSAAHYAQPDVIEEAFRNGFTVHQVTNREGVYPPLVNAAAWARSERFDMLRASCFIMASESFGTRGDLRQSAAMLEEAVRAMNRTDLPRSRLGARFQYQTALLGFQTGKHGSATAALAEATRLQRLSSNWLFQIVLTDRLASAGVLSDRQADQLYATVLREPTSADWTLDPLDTFTVAATPHAGPLERWFELSILANKQPEKALEIADRVRRHRFFSMLPDGGRLVALRWILEAPEVSLSPEARLQRQDLFVKFPQYAETARQARQVREELNGISLTDNGAETKRRRDSLFQSLGRLSAAQELLLGEIALRRHGSEREFPPLRDTKAIQASLAPRQLAMVFFATQRHLHVFVFTRDQYAHWLVPEPAKLATRTGEFLRKLGMFDANQPLPQQVLVDRDWQVESTELLNQLFAGGAVDFWDRYDEMIIVPDKFLWYLPFEALCAPSAGGMTAPLLSQVRIRYAPTASLVMPDERPHAARGRSLVVQGKLFPRDSDQLALETADSLAQVLPDTAVFTNQFPASSQLLAVVSQRAIVLDDIDDPPGGPLDWSPLQVDRGKPGSALSQWLSLPWGGPEQLILPGFHTAAETGLKNAPGGDEIFLAVTGLMATGTRTILLSRWRTGGQSSHDLVREFAQELPHTNAADAWQRSVELARSAEIDPAAEPRVKSISGVRGMRAEHPFFWSGYLLVDTGSEPPPREAAPAGPILQIERIPAVVP